ncbi:SRPBCC family protein [Spongiivirga sp. MCCC 1A20706]|uniref:SRPBCC family protein n=1 Tax=Spongiivirga sp. MCCC 1A20706 TaxID=3160963 RepID=UPI003977628C
MTALYIVGGLVILILLLMIIAPKKYDVSRSITINKPKNEVFGYVRSLEKMANWSPWEEKDPNMEKKFTGTDGEVGAVSYWNGNKDVGEGEQEITKIVKDERIESSLRFFKPFKSESDCYFNFEGDLRTTKLTWGFSGKHKPVASIFMMFMGSMDKAVGGDFEKGLAKLKSIIEA